MSEPIPESIPTSFSRPSQRPTKKRLLHNSSNPSTSSNPAVAAQAAHLSALFANPDKPVALPPSSSSALTKGRGPSALPPEIVANVQGSSAGAGSGEFHVYKASRRREYERLRRMEEEVTEEKADEEWERGREERRRRDEERTEKKRRRRKKGKGGKGGEKGGEGAEGMATGMNVVGGGEKADGEWLVAAGVEEKGVIIHDDD